jgi:acyl-CoA reductase-like NAD-dependent aldehyde dehydrogenase
MDTVTVVNFIGGGLAAPLSGDYAENIEPATGKVLCDVAVSGASDVERAYLAARAAQPAWAGLGLAGRAERLRAWADALIAAEDELSMIDSMDSGIPRRTTRAGIRKAAEFLRYFSGIAPQIMGANRSATDSGLRYTRLEPYGVVGAIIPYNHAAMFAVSKAAAALVMGNTVVLKPAEQSPMSAARIAQLTEGILPNGVYNVVQGRREVGAALVGHRDIWRVKFTGGVPTALDVMRAVAESGRIKHITYELGGKNPLIVFDDADPARAAAAAVRGMNFTRNQGQSCGSTSRLFVHEEIADDVVEAVVAETAEIRLGLPQLDHTEMGPLVSVAHQERVSGLVDDALADGAVALCGGAVPAGFPDGSSFYLPTVLDGVDEAMTVARQEVFGPVLTIHRWRDVDDMVARVNDSEYGLTAAIYTNRIGVAVETANAVQCGYVWINDVETRWVGMPFGGYKNSGQGHEHSEHELYSMVTEKAIGMSF